MLKINYDKELQIGEVIFLDDQIIAQEKLVKNQNILVIDNSGIEFKATITELKTDNADRENIYKAILNHGLFSIKEATQIKEKFKFKEVSPEQLLLELNHKLIDRVVILQKLREKRSQLKKGKRTLLEGKHAFLGKIIKTSNELKKYLIELNEQAKNKFLSDYETINTDVFKSLMVHETAVKLEEGAEFNRQIQRKILPNAKDIEDQLITKNLIAIEKKTQSDTLYIDDELIKELNGNIRNYNENQLVSYTETLITTLQQFIPFIATLNHQLGRIKDGNKSTEESRILYIILRRMYKFYTCENVKDTIEVESNVTHKSDDINSYKGELLDFIYEVLEMVHAKTGIVLLKKDTIGEYLKDSCETEKKRDETTFCRTSSIYVSDQELPSFQF